ncbi:hypothetical protein QJQ45_020513 [Haematococcus lacustris]|nr:hypothetical protein QJQ45_020513 [Haematococcus lacustris]
MVSHNGAWTCWVVVLGDFGRSPRMQYHTLSLSHQHNARVHVVAYAGSSHLPELQRAANVCITSLREPAAWLQRLPRPLALIMKALQQVLQLLWLFLVALPRPQCILVQNPPAIPTMALCWLAAVRHQAKLIIDWHNYGYTILALSQGSGHWLVSVARAYERFWGRRGHAHFCVTKAMQQELKDSWGVTATVLYDRPPAFFRRTPLPAVHALMAKLEPALHSPDFSDWLSVWQQQQPPQPQQAPQAHDSSPGPGSSQGTTLLTTATPIGQAAAAHQGSGQTGCGGLQLRMDRPAVVVSSTSWTPDEDFSILLAAAQLYDTAVQAAAAATASGGLPRVLFLITGKGPQRDMYLQQLRGMTFKHVAFRTLWLEPGDYPLLLGTADIGVSLHASSSGLDLPMKVVDMFGSGLPVFALAYSCIHELVEEGQTGLLFSDAPQLALNLQTLLTGFPAHPSSQLLHMQQRVAAQEQALRWEENWSKVAWPCIRP